MKSPLVLLLAIVLSLPLAALAAADAHDHGKPAPHKLELNADKKWGTDDALRQEVRDWLAANWTVKVADLNEFRTTPAYRAWLNKVVDAYLGN